MAAFDPNTKFSWLPDDVIKHLANLLYEATYPKIRFSCNAFIDHANKTYDLADTLFWFNRNPIVRSDIGWIPMKHLEGRREIRSNTFGECLGSRDLEDFLNGSKAHYFEYFSTKRGSRHMRVHFHPRWGHGLLHNLTYILERAIDEMPGIINRMHVALIQPTPFIGKDGKLWVCPPVIHVALDPCSKHNWAWRECKRRGMQLREQFQTRARTLKFHQDQLYELMSEGHVMPADKKHKC